jgi:hypothetical protein
VPRIAPWITAIIHLLGAFRRSPRRRRCIDAFVNYVLSADPIQRELAFKMQMQFGTKPVLLVNSVAG